MTETDMRETLGMFLNWEDASRRDPEATTWPQLKKALRRAYKLLGRKPARKAKL